MEFILYHDSNIRLAQYIELYSSLSGYISSGRATTKIIQLPKENSKKEFAELPESLRRLLFFAKPDLVICIDDGKTPIKPIFAIEITEHVPARDHWMQRFNNLVGCAQENIPGAYIMPFNLPNRPKFSGSIDPVFLYAYDRVMEIHQTPFYVAEWESDDGITGNSDASFIDFPDHNSIPIKNTIEFINEVIECFISGRRIVSLMRDRLIVNLRNDIRKNAYATIPKIEDFARLTFNMPNNRYLTNNEVRTWISNKGLAFPSKITDRINKRDKNLIFVPQARQNGKTLNQLRDALNKRIKDKGADPYLGQPLAFDYIFCRLGPSPYERDINLIIDLSVLKFSDVAGYHKSIWQKCPLQYDDFSQIPHVPQYTMYLTEGCAQVMKNFLRVYSFTADMIIFSDGIVYF